MSFYSESVVKRTKRAHRCDWCNEAIPAGESCVKHAGMGEDFFSGWIHFECAAALRSADWVRQDGYDQGAQARGRTDDDRSAKPEFTPENYKKGAKS